ncbi:MAG: glycosyl hydrolase family 8 [Chitinispirillaceae bacterium]
MKRSAIVIAAIVGLFSAALAVPVDINSGDPACPFPQFLPYVHPDDTLHNLATKNPVGVVHAEMEQTIRDAYQIMMNRAEYHKTDELEGKKYIQFESDPDCSEGTGYALLAAAMMADKSTFDGLWLFTHDYAMNKVVRYMDGQPSPAYDYSRLPGWQNAAGGNSATDGDVDIALALFIAYQQWGEFMGIDDSRGNPISYKYELVEFLKGLTDTVLYAKNNTNLVSGVIGFDGYVKNGDSWPETTDWARDSENLSSIGIFRPAEAAGPQDMHVDYTSPAYFNQFRKFLSAENPQEYAWNISQFERGEASSDWLVGKLYEQDEATIPYAGWVQLENDTTPVFSDFMEGEDFRYAWRTILNYVWHGNSTMSWDPVNHSVLRNVPNTYQRDMGQRYARFLWDNRQEPWNNSCTPEDEEGYWGPSVLRNHYDHQGELMGDFFLNWVPGTGSPAGVTSQDFDLMAELYRQCAIEWDVEENGDRYLTSKPVYFHGFFRLLGMNILTGNHHAPLDIKPSANMKVYLDVDRTYAFENDTITYTIDYRNYGSVDALNTKMVNRLHSDFVYISSTGDGVYDPASHSVEWNVGTVPGFKTATGAAPTEGSVQLKVVIPMANQKRYQNQVEISCSNGSGWVSNEYPNHYSPVMKRNGVDIARRSLVADHSVFRDTINPGMTAEFSIDFENTSEAGWLNGGRPGVYFSYWHNGTEETDVTHRFIVKMFSDAHEPYIDYGNYRISYFINDQGRSGISSEAEESNGWIVSPMVLEGLEEEGLKLFHESIPLGEDERGKWNQRLVMQFSDPTDPLRPDTNWSTMAPITRFLQNQYGQEHRVHRGLYEPLRTVWGITGAGYVESNWGDDWSFNAQAVSEDDEGRGFPITPDFTDPAPDNPGVPVTSWNRKFCARADYTVDNILIEEYDGYTWRRVFGNGPMPGRDVEDVVIRDTIPEGLTFEEFVGEAPFGIDPVIEDNVITWSIPKLQVGEKGSLTYRVRADTPSVNTAEYHSRAWVSSVKESSVSSRAVLVVTHDELPPLPPEPTSMHKEADRRGYLAGDTVTYSIAYKQTHGNPVSSAPASEWQPVTGDGVSVDETGRISFSTRDVQSRHTGSFGMNGILRGHFEPAEYADFFIVARQSESEQVEVCIRKEYADLQVSFLSNGEQIGPVHQVVYPSFPDPFDYKIEFREDTVRLWAEDTSSAFPAVEQTGIPVRYGYAGVRTGNDLGAAITGWSSHFDVAYDVAVRDTVPWGIRFLSSEGSIVTGSLAGTEINAQTENGVITWPVVSGDTYLEADDSLYIEWKGIVDTSRNSYIINTAYTDLRGYPLDEVGAQAQSRFGEDTIPVIPEDTLKDLTLAVEPQGGIFTGEIEVVLTASEPGASIYFTTNNLTPDSSSIATRLYTGEPLRFHTATTLKAIAYAPGCRPSEVAVQEYEPLVTVPVLAAYYYDNTGDGLANGVRLLLSDKRQIEPDLEIIKKHLSLLSFSADVRIDSLSLVEDSLFLVFGGSGTEPDEEGTVSIAVPQFPDSDFTCGHGYLAEDNLDIHDGIAPYLLSALYRPALESDASGEKQDTLVVEFNEYARLTGGKEEVSPFVVSNGTETYTFTLDVLWREYNKVYFLVTRIGGETGQAVPAKGDSVRIIPGEISDHFMNVQDHPLNRAVPLEVEYPEVSVSVTLGPNPFRRGGSVSVRVTVEPHFPMAFANLDPKLCIYDNLGNVVVPERSVGLSSDGERYEYIWRGTNRYGRLVGTGTYLVVLEVEGAGGEREVVREKVYFHGR